MDLHKLPRLQKVLLLDKISKGEISIKEACGSDTQIFFCKDPEPDIWYSDTKCTKLADPGKSRHETILFLPSNGKG